MYLVIISKTVVSMVARDSAGVTDIESRRRGRVVR